MCGRYLLTKPTTDLARLFGFIELPNLAPNWNIAPTQEAPVIRTVGRNRSCAKIRWGFIKNRAHSSSRQNPLINARGETIAEKPSFKESFKKHRCLVPADGFYEWRGKGDSRQAFFADPGETIAFAGLWENSRKADGTTLETFTIVTTEANQSLASIHHRMPVVIQPEDFDTWLRASLKDAADLIRAASEERFRLVEVDKRVGNVKHNDPELVIPINKRTSKEQLHLF
ncbi:MAG: SOS response-associated peptidase [Rhodospirillales bacterium]